MDGGADTDNGSIKRLAVEALPVLNEGIYLVLSRWSALYLAVENEWGGRRSHHLADQLASDVFAWEFLMNIYGLGVKTVECILLLTLQQKAFRIITFGKVVYIFDESVERDEYMHEEDAVYGIILVVADDESSEVLIKVLRASLNESSNNGSILWKEYVANMQRHDKL